MLIQRPFAALTIGLTALLAACATPLVPPVEGYLCCNIGHNSGWVYSSNYLGGAYLPLGQPVSLSTIKRTAYVYGTAGGSAFGFGHDSARTKDDTLAWLNALVVPTDPTARLNSFSTPVRAAILSARVFKGMSREQVLMSLGPPSPAEVSDLKASKWRYWTVLDDTPVDLTFDQSDLLSEITGSPGALKFVQAPQ